MQLRIILGILLTLGSAPDLVRAAGSAQSSEQVSFHNGNVTLLGTLYLPAGGGRHPAVVVFHAASGGTRDFHAYQHLATALPAAGIAVLLFDRRGSGTSTGDFNTATFRDLAADGIAGVGLLKSRRDIDPVRIGVWGVSQGGWIGPLAATMSRDIAFVISVSGPGVSPAGQMDYAAATALRAAGHPPEIIDRALRIRAVVNDYYRGRATRNDAENAIATIRHEPWFSQVLLPGRGDLPADPKLTKWCAEMDYDPLAALARIRIPIAFFFAQTDSWIPVEESIANIRQASRSHSAVTIRRIPQADHLMETGTPDSGGPISELYLSQLLGWLRQTITR
jgi:hypothetical protein